MGHQQLYWSHPRKFGQGSRSWSPSLLEQTRPDPKIRTEHVPSVLQTIRQGYWICQAGLKSAVSPDGSNSLDVGRDVTPVLQINCFFLSTPACLVVFFMI